MSEREDFKVGTHVAVAGPHVFGILDAFGFHGTVVRVHDTGEVTHCVELLISRIYKPCFWFHWSRLKAREGEPQAPVATVLSRAVGGRTANLPFSPITLGCLQSWMHLRVRPAPGHPLEVLIRTTGFDYLLNLFGDASDLTYSEWVATNDMRPKRAQINVLPAVDAQEINIRRPKMGGI